MLTRFIRFLSLLPLMTVFSFAALVCGARHDFGHWPTRWADDLSYYQGGVLFNNLHDLFQTCLVATPLSAPIWLVLIYWQWLKNPMTAKANLSLFALGWAAIILIIRFDPGRYLEWFLD